MGLTLKNINGSTGRIRFYLNQPVPTPPSSLLLDTYTGAAVAYSLRQLRTAYTGAAIRVRRSSDNAEQDINFVGGDLDTQSLLDFVGYNLLTYSEDFTIATPIWNKYQTTITADVETAPDGTLTGDKLVESAVNGYHYLDRTNYAITNGVDYNISIYLKQAERTKILFGSAISGTNTSCDIDLTNGTISNSTFTNTPVITAEANGWYRFSVTITSGTTSAAPLIRLFPYNASNQLIYTGDGNSGFYVWGAQLTQSSDVRNYTKTGATANAGNGFVTTWYDQSGNANDATQSTAANQCQIVSSGNLILDADTSKITTTWTTDRYSLTTGISTNTQYLSISMWRRLSTGDRMVHLANTDSSNYRNTLTWNSNASSNSLVSFMNTSFSYQNVATLGRCIVTSLKDSVDLKVAYRNGVQLTNTSTEAPGTGTLTVLGQFGTTIYTSGQYQEYIYWDSEQSANRTAIEDNINTYWDAY